MAPMTSRRGRVADGRAVRTTSRSTCVNREHSGRCMSPAALSATIRNDVDDT